MNKIKVLITDDHYLFAEGIKKVLATRNTGIKVVGIAKDGLQALEKIKQLSPDVTILDLQMPRLDGIETLRKIKEQGLHSKILILTTFMEESLIRDAIALGADGYLLKDAPVDVFIRTIRSVAEGSVILSSPVAETLANSGPESYNEGLCRVVHHDQPLNTLFTSREKEIFEYLLDGFDNRRISDELCISDKTVRNHISTIYEKVGVHNRAQLIIWAIDKGLVK